MQFAYNMANSIRMNTNALKLLKWKTKVILNLNKNKYHYFLKLWIVELILIYN